MADGEPQPKPDAAKVKQIKIQTGVVQRTGKEKMSYVKETDKQTEKLEQMKAEGKDEYEIKNAVQCRDESKNMIRVVGKQLVDRHQVLVDLKKEVEGDELIKETKEYEKMLQVLEEVKTALEYTNYT